jgi:hypothetical protein
MGLDMYLKAKRYYTNYSYNEHAKNEKEINAKIKEVLGLSHLDEDDNSIEVSVNIAYWRKANAIHNWFVEVCQEGKDECQESYVGRDQLIELRDLCTEVLDTKDATKLPPTAGFFFGSTEIDEWYWSDIEATRDKLDTIISNNALEDFDFYYHASW